MAMAAFARCGVDMILSGHLHVSRRGASAVRYRIPGYSALMVQAGTATSSRRRGELNSYNIIRIERPEIAIDTPHMGRRARRLRPSGDGSVPIGTRRLVAGCRKDGCRCLTLGERGARGHRWLLPPCASACSSGWQWPPPPGAVGSFDERVRAGIHQFASPDLTLLAGAITRLGSAAVIASFFGLAVVGFYASGRRRSALALAVVMAGAIVLENALRIRPPSRPPGVVLRHAAGKLRFPQRPRPLLGLFLWHPRLDLRRQDRRCCGARGHLDRSAGADRRDRTLADLSRLPLPDRRDRGLPRSGLLAGGIARLAVRPRR